LTNPAHSVVPGWRKSTFSGNSGCVEIGELPDGGVAVRNSKAPEAGIVVFTRHEFDVFLRGAAAGEFDDLR
jgi:hypothetical protein